MQACTFLVINIIQYLHILVKVTGTRASQQLFMFGTFKERCMSQIKRRRCMSKHCSFREW